MSLYKFVGGRLITETTGIILACFDKNFLEPTKNTKNLTSLLTNLLHQGPFKQPCAPHAAREPGFGQPCVSRWSSVKEYRFKTNIHVVFVHDLSKVWSI